MLKQVTWPIDEDTFNNADKIDQEAKNMYRALLYKWERKEFPNRGDPDNNCLAVSR